MYQVLLGRVALVLHDEGDDEVLLGELPVEEPERAGGVAGLLEVGRGRAEEEGADLREKDVAVPPVQLAEPGGRRRRNIVSNTSFRIKYQRRFFFSVKGN